MTMQELVRTVLSKYATFTGRASRSEFWWWSLAVFLASLVLAAVERLLFGHGYGVMSSLFSLAVILPNLAARRARRLHDTDRTRLVAADPAGPDRGLSGLAVFPGAAEHPGDEPLRLDGRLEEPAGGVAGADAVAVDAVVPLGHVAQQRRGDQRRLGEGLGFLAPEAVGLDRARPGEASGPGGSGSGAGAGIRRWRRSRCAAGRGRASMALRLASSGSSSRLRVMTRSKPRSQSGLHCVRTCGLARVGERAPGCRGRRRGRRATGRAGRCRCRAARGRLVQDRKAADVAEDRDQAVRRVAGDAEEGEAGAFAGEVTLERRWAALWL